MNIRVPFAIALAILAASPCAAAGLSNKDLVAECSKKTIVYGRDAGELVRAGEKISGFCSGYLQATLSAAMNAGTCTAQGDDADFLLSVYAQYVQEQNIPESASASQTLTHALRRIVQCK